MSRAPNFPTSRFTITKAVIAGEPKTYDLVRGMCPPGATVNNLYAQTENGPGVSFGDHDCMDYEINKHTHGRPLPGVQLIIKCLDTGERLPQGQAGEICYKSPFMFRGYHKQEQETNDSFDAEGYFHSGDFGSFDNGYITFLGRLGGVIKSGGENVSTLRVTNLLLELFKDEFDLVPFGNRLLVAAMRYFKALLHPSPFLPQSLPRCGNRLHTDSIERRQASQ